MKLSKTTLVALMVMVPGVAMAAGHPNDGRDSILAIMILGGMVAIYFIPVVVASGRAHRNIGAIFALNLFLGWTLIGWVGALVWALARE